MYRIIRIDVAIYATPLRTALIKEIRALSRLARTRITLPSEDEDDDGVLSRSLSRFSSFSFRDFSSAHTRTLRAQLWLWQVANWNCTEEKRNVPFENIFIYSVNLKIVLYKRRWVICVSTFYDLTKENMLLQESYIHRCLRTKQWLSIWTHYGMYLNIIIQ